MADRAIEPELLKDFSANQLADVLYSYGTLGPKHEALLLRFADHATSKAVLNTFKACDVAQVVWTYATFAQEDHLLMSAMAERAMHPTVLEKFNIEDVSMVCWAYTTLGIRHTALFEALERVQSEARILGGFVSPDLHKLVTWGSALLMFLLAMNVVDNGANTHPSLSDRGE
jgi:hypothetical protein